MNQAPSDNWRFAKWLSIRDAASLAANVDPETPDTELKSVQRKNVRIFQKAIWETARTERDNAGVRIEYYPDVYGNYDYDDESDSRVSTLWLKAFLASQGGEASFFSPVTSTTRVEPWMDPTHTRFSPELAFAVRVWTALSDHEQFRSSPKADIENWIEENAAGWQGDKPMSTSAKKRIATLVNWKSEGGAPKTGR